ncbi:MAG: hypothetical protein HXX20_02220 [Chloroflexi bacterium]|nr:hypothetical protein [Chloroflexota bacterium]
MALDTDAILGTAYLSVSDFKARSDTFGATEAIASKSDTAILGYLASASRAIDNYLGRHYGQGNFTENHKWDFYNKRIYPNCPPVISLVSYKLRTGANYLSTFVTSPVNGTTFGEIYYNQQENYLEIASMASAFAMTTQLLGLGLKDPQVEIVYTSWQTVPQSVAAATGYTAAMLATEALVNQQIPLGIQMMQADSVKIQRAQRGSGDQQITLPAMALMLLSNEQRILIG